MSTYHDPDASPSPPSSAADDGLGDRVPGQAQSAISQARARARAQVDQRASDLGGRASSVAEDLRSVAEHLRSQDREGPAGLVDHAAARVAGAGDYLQTTNGNLLLHDLESLGRRRPWAAIAGGLAAGVAASRLLKASSRERYETTGRYGAAPRSPSPSAAPVSGQEHAAYAPATSAGGARRDG